MLSSPEIYVSSVGRSQGRSRKVMPDIPEGERHLLDQSGYSRYVASDKPVADMASEAMADCLTSAAVKPSSITDVFAVTESLWDSPFPGAGTSRPHADVRDALLQAVHDTVGAGAQVHGMWMSGCGNLAPALRLARSIAASANDCRALVVCSDRVPPNESRIFNGGSLFSDVAAACIVSVDPGPFRLDGVVTHLHVPIVDARRDRNTVKVAVEIRKALLALDDKVLAATGRRLSSYDHVITENLNALMIESCRTVLGMPEERMLSPSKEDVAHAFAGDLLLSLGMLAANRDIAPGSKCAAISLASWMMSAILLSASPE